MNHDAARRTVADVEALGVRCSHLPPMSANEQVFRNLLPPSPRKLGGSISHQQWPRAHRSSR